MDNIEEMCILPTFSAPINHGLVRIKNEEGARFLPQNQIVVVIVVIVHFHASRIIGYAAQPGGGRSVDETPRCA